MNKFNPESMRFVSILVGLCLVFALIVRHAYSYIPTDEKINTETSFDVVQPIRPLDDLVNEKFPERLSTEHQYHKIHSNEENYQNVYRETQVHNTNSLASYDDVNLEKEERRAKRLEERKLNEIEKIQEVSQSEIDSYQYDKKQDFDKIIEKAKYYSSNKNYSSAIPEFKHAVTITENVEDKAFCYEKLAEIYAYAKQYDSALTAAKKAYELAPSVEREFLLARIYYKLGETGKASQHLKNVLKTDIEVSPIND